MTPLNDGMAIIRSSSGGGTSSSSMTNPTRDKRWQWKESLRLSLIVLTVLLPSASDAARLQQRQRQRRQQQHAEQRWRQQEHRETSPAVGRRTLMDGIEACALCPNDFNLSCVGKTWGDQCLPCSEGQLWWPCNLPDECLCQDSIGNVVMPGDLLNEDTAEDGLNLDAVATVKPTTMAPTKYPTIVPPDDEYEIVPIRFDVMGLPGNVAIGELEHELKTVMTRIILRLAQSIEGLSITKVEEKAGGVTDNSEGGKSAYFNIYARRVEEKKFAPLIVQAIRDSYDEVLEQIQTFTDTKYLTEDVTINICAMQNGEYDACSNDDPTPPPSSSQVIPPPPVALADESDPDEGGLDGWAISLMVIFVLLLVCCIGYAIAVICFGVANCFDDCFRDHDDTKEIHNNGYFDDRSRESRRSKKMLAIEDGTRASGYASRRSGPSHEIVLANPQDLSFDDDSFTINTYGTKRKQGRDPTRYIPGQEDKPDPDSESGWFSDGNSSRGYHEDPPLKPKREPTMYFDGKRSDEDPPSMPMREPTMYIDGHRESDMHTKDDSTIEEVHNDYHGVGKRYGMAGRDPTFYDSAGRDPTYYDPAGRDPTFYVDDAERDEVSHSMKSARSKKSTGSKKSIKGKSEDKQKSSESNDWDASNSENSMYKPAKRASLRLSLVSNFDYSGIQNDHANSYTDGVRTRDDAADSAANTRQTKSFYR